MRSLLLIWIVFIVYPLISFGQVKEITSPTIHFEYFSVEFSDVTIWGDTEVLENVSADKILLYLELGETVQDLKIKIGDLGLSQLRIYQQYETSLSITNEGPHLDLLKWKHFTSNWNEINQLEQNIFKTLSYNEKEEEQFPEFSEGELIEYLKSIGYAGYADLIKNPKYPNGEKHWWIGLSIVRFKISGIDSENNKIEKLIEFEVPMGC